MVVFFVEKGNLINFKFDTSRWYIALNDIPQVSQPENEFLTAPFTKKEIQGAAKGAYFTHKKD